MSARTDLLLRSSGLLIADECHRYGSGVWSEALHPTFSKRLGLTATLERQDDGDARLAEYFGDTPVFDIDYRRALAEGVVSPFRLAMVGVDLTSDERVRYEEHDADCRRYRGKLINTHQLPASPFGQFMLETKRAATGVYGPVAARVAKGYLNHFSKRKALLADTSTKLERLAALEAVIASASGTLVFTQTRLAAQTVATQLTRNGHRAAAIWGEMNGADREQLLQAFRERDGAILTSPRILDEGVDVPNADLGIVLSASSGRRQMIQRMGRILRLKFDNRHARMVILYAVGTSEDPALGAHEGFLELAREAAEAERTFAPDVDAEEIRTFLEH